MNAYQLHSRITTVVVVIVACLLTIPHRLVADCPVLSGYNWQSIPVNFTQAFPASQAGNPVSVTLYPFQKEQKQPYYSDGSFGSYSDTGKHSNTTDASFNAVMLPTSEQFDLDNYKGDREERWSCMTITVNLTVASN